MSAGSGPAPVTEEAVAVSSPAPATAKSATQPLGPSAPGYGCLNNYSLIQDIWCLDSDLY